LPNKWLKSGLKIWIKLEMTDLIEQETLKVRDVTNIGNLGCGNTEALVNMAREARVLHY
jgi:predicted transport protein